jgi:tetratricopeptide (TPR) repeat protein
MARPIRFHLDEHYLSRRTSMLPNPTRLVLTLSLVLASAGVAGAELPGEPGKQPPKADKQQGAGVPDRAELERLVQRLGSASFADREEATRQLERIGKPALEALRTAAASGRDPEIRRRAATLVDRLLEPPYSKAFKEGCRLLEGQKDYRKAAALFEQAAELYRKDPSVARAAAGTEDEPALAEIYLRLARAHRGLEEYEKAGSAYHCAIYHYNYNRDQREQVEHEWSAMIDRLLKGWEKDVKAKAGKDAALKGLTAKYPLVVLHSRRLAGGNYFKSAYSFIYETADRRKHFNDVQILFDNGSKQNTFNINMTVGQHNLVADLGDVDFTKGPDPRNLDPDGDNFWEPDGCKAVEGHVYLERVRDSFGNKFYVVKKVVAADKESRYMAFLWRRLPGGKVVKRR